ncbi:uncharacterized protein N7484_003510 [Penicillium longicatenatum]|uniref:uncharacterized protein n=1 Tax=Penicillium longicatenatum TaxID=1561947 RepID=UPI00254705DF|nr:uncharacterized protein N7484_003510 [Penicillium longicatenatum]KAJ5649787.1 hypothetical protein N7484_003510 [Penicillium longicatenatum]
MYSESKLFKPGWAFGKLFAIDARHIFSSLELCFDLTQTQFVVFLKSNNLLPKFPSHFRDDTIEPFNLLIGPFYPSFRVSILLQDVLILTYHSCARSHFHDRDTELLLDALQL